MELIEVLVLINLFVNFGLIIFGLIIYARITVISQILNKLSNPEEMIKEIFNRTGKIPVVKGPDGKPLKVKDLKDKVIPSYVG